MQSNGKNVLLRGDLSCIFLPAHRLTFRISVHPGLHKQAHFALHQGHDVTALQFKLQEMKVLVKQRTRNQPTNFSGYCWPLFSVSVLYFIFMCARNFCFVLQLGQKALFCMSLRSRQRQGIPSDDTRELWLF